MEVSHVSTTASSPPDSVLLLGSPIPQPMPVLRLEQLWPQLPASRREAIGAILAQMIARQMAAMHSPVAQEEHHE